MDKYIVYFTMGVILQMFPTIQVEECSQTCRG